MNTVYAHVKVGVMGIAAFLLVFGAGASFAETLNPEGVNPHQVAPRKRITQEQKKAAWEARKKKKAEIEARKAAQKAGQPYDVKELSKP